jgi:hypothetical protein
MIGTASRPISEEKINNSVCSHCDAKNTLLVRVSSKFFMLKILPFVYGKALEIECSQCRKISTNEYGFEPGTKMRIEAVKETAKHKWFLYLGYIVIGIALIIGLTMDRPPSN